MVLEEEKAINTTKLQLFVGGEETDTFEVMNKIKNIYYKRPSILSISVDKVDENDPHGCGL